MKRNSRVLVDGEDFIQLNYPRVIKSLVNIFFSKRMPKMEFFFSVADKGLSHI